MALPGGVKCVFAHVNVPAHRIGFRVGRDFFLPHRHISSSRGDNVGLQYLNRIIGSNQEEKKQTVTSNTSRMTDLQNKSRAELQILAKETGACRANAKTNDIVQSLISYYEEQDKVSKGTSMSSINGRSFLIPTITLPKLNSTTGVDAEEVLRTTVFRQNSLSHNSQGTPVVLDAGALSMDGSPHHTPLTSETFSRYISIIKEARMIPIAICNASNDVKNIAREGYGIPYVVAAPQSAPAPQAVSSTASQADFSQEKTPQISNLTGSEGVRASRALARKRIREEANARLQERMIASQKSNKPVIPLNVPSASAARETPIQQVPVVKEIIRTEETKVVKESVRTGQQITSSGSLVVWGSVRAGGEVLAAGDIHIYGRLSGRAAAGVNGDPKAVIYAHQFDPEMISISGSHVTGESIFETMLREPTCPVSVSLSSEKGARTLSNEEGTQFIVDAMEGNCSSWLVVADVDASPRSSSDPAGDNGLSRNVGHGGNAAHVRKI